MVEASSALLTAYAFSDIHFGGSPGRKRYCFPDDEQKLHGIIKTLRTLPPEVELVLVNGDLTHNATSREANMSARALKASPVPVVAILGNHDINKKKPNLVADVLKARGISVLQRGEIYSHTARRDGSEVLIMGVTGFSADSSCRLLLGRNGTQEMLDQLAKDDLDGMTAQMQNLNGGTNVLMMHMPIADFFDGEYIEAEEELRTSSGEPTLRGVVYEYGDKFALATHGHKHNDQTPERQWRNMTWMNTAPVRGLPGGLVYV